MTTRTQREYWVFYWPLALTGAATLPGFESLAHRHFENPRHPRCLGVFRFRPPLNPVTPLSAPGQTGLPRTLHSYRAVVLNCSEN